MNKFALIIGCDYSGSWKVYQSYNDSKKFYDILINIYNIPPDNIQTLYNKDCTKCNIIDNLKIFANKLISGTVGIIYFAGHGTQTKDTNGDEKDGLDENYQTYDRKTISDDLITSILEKTHEDSYITVISDHCHSGSMIDITDKHKDRRWLSIGSAQDNESAIQSGDGSVCSYELFKIIEKQPSITIGNMKDLLIKNMKDSFIGTMQIPNISVSNPSIYGNYLFSSSS